MITIVDYDAGNLKSVERACAAIQVPTRITADPEDLDQAERIIFPGIGAASSAMATLQSKKLDLALKTAFDRGCPILGICIGAQIILDHSEEGNQDCLGFIPGQTKRFKLQNPSLKVPHIGWNGVTTTHSHPVLDGIQPGDEFYFVHSYFPSPEKENHILAKSNYESDFCCALGDKNLVATQFHPEKSGQFGLNLLKKFSKWDGTL